MPALVYPACRHSSAAPRRISASCPGSSRVHEDSSITFWWRRWSVQSRRPTGHTPPWWSAITWTSTWRAFVIWRSRNTVGSPNAWRASARAASKAPASSAGFVTRRMPRPPPPPVALTNSG